jgi:haloacid dehalogenase superfamily, subfamily IA, variant 1 with third motif having Dx(3-4)D or Dx(3-4)E
MRYGHVIFDLDGTIINNDFVILQSLQDTLRELKGRNYSHDEMHMALGVPSYVPLRHFGVSNIPEAIKRWASNMAAYADKVQPFPEVEELISELRVAGVNLGIVTSRRRDEYVTDFLPFGLHPLFGTVICADDTFRHKPEPEPILAYLEQSNTEKGDAIYIGDSQYDMECANAAGVDGGHAIWARNREKHPKAKYHFNTADELRKLLFS